jgi:hypothetical protein
VCAAVLPSDQREELVRKTDGSILLHANKRADEIAKARKAKQN